MMVQNWKILLVAGLIFVVWYSASPSASGQGALDPLFYTGAGPSGHLQAIAVLPDGKILAAGEFSSVVSPFSGLDRLVSSGGVDATFRPVFNPNEPVYALAVQADGLVLAGRAYSPRLARLRSDGNLDPAFNVGTGPSDSLSAIVLQSDGRILISGGFTSYNGTNANRIARLNANGSFDNSFNVESGADDFVKCIALQSDGKILLCGDFTHINGTNCNYLARLNPDGSLDPSFLAGSGSGPNGYVESVLLQSNGQLIIAGYFNSFNGTNRNTVARLNSDGSLDLTFDSGSGADSFVNTAALQPDGKVLVGGWFTHFNGMPRNNIARLNTDGSLDTSFDPVNGLGAAGLNVECLAVQPDQKVLVGGWNGISRLLLAEPPLLTNLTLQLDGTAQISGLGPTNAHLRLYASTNLYNWLGVADTTNLAGAFHLTDSNAAAFPQRFYRVLWMP